MFLNDPDILELKPDAPGAGNARPVTSLSRAAEPFVANADVVPEFAPSHSGHTDPPADGSRRFKWRITKLSLLLFMLSALSVAGHYGYVFKNSLYDAFPMIRHQYDIGNAWRQGLAVNDLAREFMRKDDVRDADGRPLTTPPLNYLYRGWVERFDDVYERGQADEKFDFDYVPLRLLIPTLWVRQIQAGKPTQTEWEDGFAFTRFMLTVNQALTAFTAIGMFLLIRHWVLRAGRAPEPSPVVRLLDRTSWRIHAVSSERGRVSAPLEKPTDARVIKAWALAGLGALLVWWEPNILIESHIWPQWDLWIVPFYVIAVYLCSTGWWFCAGLSLGVGVMMKGQLFFGLPVLMLWPIFDARPGNAARLLTGFATGFLGVAAPWLLQTGEAVRYVVLVGGMAAAIASCKLARKDIVLAIALPVVVLVVVAPTYFAEANDGAWDTRAVTLAKAAAFVLVAGAWFLPRRSLGVVVAASLCVSVVVAALSFGGTWSWWHIGFGYGTHHYQKLYMGPSPNNLAALLSDVYRWELYDVVTTFPIPASLAAMPMLADYVQDGRLVVTIKLLMTSLFVVAIPLCAWGVARHARRNDPRFLIAITAPWVILFAVLPQMHERYLFWAGVVSVACVGASSGGFFLYLTVSLFSFAMILHCQLRDDPNEYLIYPRWLAETLMTARYVLVRAHPGLGWAMLLIAAVFLYMTLTPSRRAKTP